MGQSLRSGQLKLIFQWWQVLFLLEFRVEPVLPEGRVTVTFNPLLFSSQLNPPVTLILQDDTCWLAKLSLVPGEGDANSVIYKKGQHLCSEPCLVWEGEGEEGGSFQ